MKNFVFTAFCFLLSLRLISQVNVNADCINAITLCNSPNFQFNATSGQGSVIDFTQMDVVSNPTTNPFPPDQGCLKWGELNPQWLLLTVGNPGVLEFVFGAANSPNPQAGCYDWMMWPYNANTCANIKNNTLPPIRCNWNSSCSNGTGLASKEHVLAIGGDTLDFGEPLQVNACQQFIICISNFSGVNTMVSFQTLGTASLSCDPDCSPNYTICEGTSATITPVNYAALTNPTFSLMPGNLSNTTGNFVVTPNSTTNYTTYITGTNLSNAVETLTAISVVSVVPLPIVAVTVTQSTCEDPNTNLNVNLTWLSSAPATYTLNWLPMVPNGILTPTSTAANAVMAPGIYTLTVVRPFGCSTTKTFQINPPKTPAVITRDPSGDTLTLTCYVPSIPVSVLNAGQSYTWTNLNTGPITASTVVMTSSMVGGWTVVAQNTVSGCTTSQTFAILENTLVPTAAVSPSFQNITCTVTSIQTVTSTATPTSNVTHMVMSPLGGTFATTSHSMVYLPGAIGTYTHCTINELNGCSSCRTFTVYSNQGFPTFSLVSAENFSLGCNTRSVANINITNASATNSNQVPNSGPVTFTILPPNSSPILPNGLLNTSSHYTVNLPGTWTVVTRDNNSSCETRVPMTILQNTMAPNLKVSYPTNIIDCNVQQVTLTGSSQTPNVGYTWKLPATPPTLANPVLVVNTNSAQPTNSVVGNYTLEILDLNSTCMSSTVVTIYQTLHPPLAAFSGTGALSCITRSLELVNQSSSTIPKNSIFATNQPAAGFRWEGPPPQVPLSNSTSYVARTPGVYTMTSKDMNNGCVSTYTANVLDNIKYPIVNHPDKPAPSILDCGAIQATLMPILTSFSTGATFTWTAPGEAFTSDKNKIPLMTNMVGEYRLAVRNPSSGCVTQVMMPVVNGELITDFKADKESGFAPLEVTFENKTQSTTGTTSITSVWSFGNGKTHTVSGVSSVKTVFNSAGTYSVTLFASKGTCLKSTTKVIHVEIPSELEIPNIFTPNDDGVNDFFFIKGTNLSNIELTIVDRWGHMVYQLNTGNGNVLWDGKNQTGKKVADGVYFYTLKASGTDGVNYDETGTVTLTR